MGIQQALEDDDIEYFEDETFECKECDGQKNYMVGDKMIPCPECSNE